MCYGWSSLGVTVQAVKLCFMVGLWFGMVTLTIVQVSGVSPANHSAILSRVDLCYQDLRCDPYSGLTDPCVTKMGLICTRSGFTKQT